MHVGGTSIATVGLPATFHTARSKNHVPNPTTSRAPVPALLSPDPSLSRSPSLSVAQGDCYHVESTALGILHASQHK